MTSKRKTEKRKYGYFKEEAKIPTTVTLFADDFADLNRLGRESGISGSYIMSWWTAAILRNDDFLRHFMQIVYQHPLYEELSSLSKEYRHEARVQRGKPLYTHCEFCGVKWLTSDMNTHLNACKSKPKLPALPLMDMEKAASKKGGEKIGNIHA